MILIALRVLINIMLDFTYYENKIFHFLKPYREKHSFVDDWYRQKVIPGKRCSERYIFSRHIESNLAAVGIAKSTREEKKISLFYVDPRFQDLELDCHLMDRMVVWLETFHPVVRMTDFDKVYFKDYIEMSEWRLTSIQCFGKDKKTCEYLYNEPKSLSMIL